MIAQDRQPYSNTRQDNQFQFFGAPTVMRSTGDTTDGHFCLMESLAMPPELASPYHLHRNEDEAFYILEGTVAFLCGDTWRVAGPGTWVYGPRGIAHGSRVIGTTPARMLVQCAPAGFERFVRELSMPVDAVPAPPDMGLLVAHRREVRHRHPRAVARHAGGCDHCSCEMSLTQSVEELRRQRVAAAGAGDAIAQSNLFAPDGVLLPPGQPALEGAAAIRAWFTGLFANVRVQGFGIQPEGVVAGLQ